MASGQVTTAGRHSPERLRQATGAFVEKLSGDADVAGWPTAMVSATGSMNG